MIIIILILALLLLLMCLVFFALIGKVNQLYKATQSFMIDASKNAVIHSVATENILNDVSQALRLIYFDLTNVTTSLDVETMNTDKEARLKSVSEKLDLLDFNLVHYPVSLIDITDEYDAEKYMRDKANEK